MPEKSWRKIVIRTPAVTGETVATWLTGLTGLGTELDEAAGPEATTTVIGYLPDDHPELPDKLAAIEVFLAALNARQPELAGSAMVTESIPEEDWSRKWREGFKSFHLTPRFVVKPSWESYRGEAGELIIEMDPGQAFGTGLHASTRLVVELLEALLPTLPVRPGSVLDVGTGTGILAICAALLDCGTVTGIDIDPAAVTSARENIEANRLSDRITASTASLDELTGPYDLILANIIHNTLVDMAPKLSALLAPGGLLVVAGILRGGQAENIRSRYNDQGLTCIAKREADEWAALALRKD
jgi:ribosomal protein L11 methyltransferase